MHDGERRGAQSIECIEAIQIADDRHDAAGTQLGNFVVAPREAVQSRAALEQRGGAERDISAANQQNPDHDLSSFTRGRRAQWDDA